MRCPFCASDDTKVLDTRLSDNGNSVRRRRKCNSCNERYSTREVAELDFPRIIKNDKSREAFNEKKLFKGFSKALEKRPVLTSDIENSIMNIKHKLITSRNTETESNLVGELVMDELKALDKVAYIRFASVYRSFADLDEFKNEIEKLIQK